MSSKQRLSVSVDADVVDAGNAAVARGAAPSLSAWVNGALRRHAEHDRRLEAVDAFLSEHEREFGDLTEAEIDGAVGRLRDGATRVRPDGTLRPVRSSRP